MSEFMDVTVSVPKDRLPEFYVMFGQWMAGPPEAAAGQLEAATPAEAWSSSDEDLATKVWNKFSPRATAVFSTLIDAPNKKISADELASMHDVPNGPIRRCGGTGLAEPALPRRGPQGVLAMGDRRRIGRVLDGRHARHAVQAGPRITRACAKAVSRAHAGPSVHERSRNDPPQPPPKFRRPDPVRAASSMRGPRASIRTAVSSRERGPLALSTDVT